MKKGTPRFRPGQKRGHVLVWMLGLLLISSVLGTAALVHARMAAQTTRVAHNRRQAEFTARSALTALGDYIVRNNLSDEALAELLARTGEGYRSEMGEYTLRLERISDTQIKITAEGRYDGQTARESLTLIRAGGSVGPLPTDNLLFLTGIPSPAVGQARLRGDLVSRGDLTLALGSSLEGNMKAGGNVIVAGGASVKGEVYAAGDLTLQNGAAIQGNITVLGNLRLGDGVNVKGNIVVNGSMTMPNGRVVGDVTVGGNVTFSGGPYITGTLNVAGSVNLPLRKQISDFAAAWNEQYPFVPVRAEPVAEGTLGIPPIPAPAERVPIPEKPAHAPYDPFDAVIDRSGVFDAEAVRQLKNLPAWQINNKITLDATAGDLVFVIKDTVFDIGSNKEINIISNGKSNVYFYLTGASGLSLPGSNHLRTFDRNGNPIPPRFFVIGDGNQAVTVKNSEFNGHIYIPNGSFSASGGAPRFLWGTCIVKTVSVVNDVKLEYIAPDLDGTPLRDVMLPGGGGGGGAWIYGNRDAG